MHNHRIYISVACILSCLFVFPVCTPKSDNDNFVSYLKAEHALRKKSDQEFDLTDSLKTLRAHYVIDMERAIARLNQEPEEWIKLFKKLQRDD
jgi:hypothetical protein